jgi:arylamine N-acetyltransferase
LSFAPEDVLDALELAAEDPSPAFLEKLFDRFNARVLFETASKIVRNADVSDPAEKPRTPDVFWRDFLESGAGGTCYARVAAFDALLTALRFPTRKVLGRVLADFDHAALYVTAGGREWLADVGFPLPALLPAGGGEADTEIVSVSATPGARGLDVRFLSGVPEGPPNFEVFRDTVTDDDFLRYWRATFRPGSTFLGSVALTRRDGSRRIRFSHGEIRIDDLHTRTRIPLAGDRVVRVAEIFGIDPDLLRRAFSIAGDPEPEIAAARITAFLSVAALPERAFDAIATPGEYRRLMEGVAEVSGEEWKLRFAPPGASGAGFEEEVTPHPDRRALAIRRRYPDGREVPLELRVEVRNGDTWLVREASLTGAREDLLRSDHARGRLAGTLAVDLLAWARRIGAD